MGGNCNAVVGVIKGIGCKILLCVHIVSLARSHTEYQPILIHNKNSKNVHINAICYDGIIQICVLLCLDATW